MPSILSILSIPLLQKSLIQREREGEEERVEGSIADSKSNGGTDLAILSRSILRSTKNKNSTHTHTCVHHPCFLTDTKIAEAINLLNKHSSGKDVSSREFHRHNL